MSGMRTRAREYALQALFFMDIRKRMSSDMIDWFAETFEPSARSVPYFRTLVQGVIEMLRQIAARHAGPRL